MYSRHLFVFLCFFLSFPRTSTASPLIEPLATSEGDLEAGQAWAGAEIRTGGVPRVIVGVRYNGVAIGSEGDGEEERLFMVEGETGFGDDGTGIPSFQL